MKKLLFIAAISAMVLNASAKHSKSSDGGLQIGIGGAYNSTWLVNTNAFAIGDELDYKSTFGGNFGITVNYNFSENMGIASGILYSMQNQKYDIFKGQSEVETHLKYIDIPILFRIGNLNQGFYFEIGPQIGILASGSEDLTITGDPEDSYAGRDVKSEFNTMNLAGVIGFGGIFNLSDQMSMSAGLRLGWGFNDVTVQRSEDELNAKSADGTVSYTNYNGSFVYKTGKDAHGNAVSLKEYDYKATNRAFGGIFISLMYKLPH